MHNIPFPTSFPNTTEEQFLKLLLCDDEQFTTKYYTWKQSIVFDETNHATAKLFPLLYLRMQKNNLVDDEFFYRIKGLYRNAWVTNQRLISVTKNILRQCHAKNIPVLILKGLPLLEEVYRNTGARFLGDADLIIPPQYAPTVISMMLENGWHYDKPWTPEVRNPAPSMYRVVKSTGMVHPHGIKLDIHWNIFGLDHHASWYDIFSLKNISSVAFREEFWNYSVETTIDNYPCKRLCNEDMLIHIIIHGSEGNNHRPLRWTVDALTLIKTLPIDWGYVLDRAISFKFHCELAVGFRYLSERLNTPIPKDFLEKLYHIPVTSRDMKHYQRFANIHHSNRYNAFGTFPLIWYAYWNYEPHQSISEFFRYIKKSLGVKTSRELFEFIFKKYRDRMKKLFPSR